MKILILTFYYYPDLCAGSFRTAAFVKALEEFSGKGYEIDIVTTMPNRYKTFSLETSKLEKLDNVTIKRIKIPGHSSGFLDQANSFAFYLAGALNYLKGRKYSIVFATSSRLFTALLGSMVAKAKGVPLYLDIRDIFSDTMKSIFSRSVIRYGLVFLPLIERYAINTADKINLVSRGFKKYFKDRYDKEYSFFPNGIDDIFLNFEPSAGVKFDNKKLIFTYTGNIGEGQGLEKIVPGIADRYKNIELRIIGAGGRASTLKVAVDGRDNVKMINPVSREKLHEFYSESDVLFLQLNDYEAFKKVLPSKIFEYGATYKPIIAGVGGYAKEFLEEYLPDCVIYRPCDLEDFCEKYNNMSFRVDIDRRKSFIEHFSRKHIMADMAKDFLTIVQKNKNK